ncbi:MAG: hypothetical protein HYY50_00600 [Candidatus Kerfeldbacteria bacterium]|nr:hypothetical protein [Candidatus Kerfeldbacteria bacterium]
MHRSRQYRNWMAICAEPEFWLRVLVTTCHDNRVLDGLAKGFPHLFGAPPKTWQPPLYFAEEVARFCHGVCEPADIATYYSWMPAVRLLQLPLLAAWRHSTVPPGVMAQHPPGPVGVWYCGDAVTYQNQTGLVVDIEYGRNSRCEQMYGWVRRLKLVPSACVDMSQRQRPNGPTT